jgi:hypothetical protein
VGAETGAFCEWAKRAGEEAGRAAAAAEREVAGAAAADTKLGRQGREERCQRAARTALFATVVCSLRVAAVAVRREEVDVSMAGERMRGEGGEGGVKRQEWSR